MAFVRNTLGSFFDSASLRAYHKQEGNQNDSSPNGYNFNISAPAPTYTTGLWGQCGVFATTKYAGLGNNIGIDGGNITVSLWINLSAQPAGGAQYNLMYQVSQTSHVSYYIDYRGTGPTVVYARGKGSSGNTESTATYTLANSRWFHLVLTYDGTSIRGYANGALIAGPTAASGNGAGNNYTGYFLAYFGDAYVAGPGFAGSIDEVLVFNRVWSAAEVYNYYQQYMSCLANGVNG